MIAAANTGQQSVAIEPTILLLLYVFGAALLTAIAAFLLAVWQSPRDHSRWLRERRYDGFTRILALADRFAQHRQEGAAMMTRSEALLTVADSENGEAARELAGLHEDMSKHLESMRPIEEELRDVGATLEILGPNKVLAARNTFTDTFTAEDEAEADLAKHAFVVAVRKSLGIRE